MRIRNARQSAAAFRSASVLKYEVDLRGHGEHIYTSYIGGSGVGHRLLEVPFCEFVMRGSPSPHSALLVFSNTKWTYAVTVGISIVRVLEAPGSDIAY